MITFNANFLTIIILLIFIFIGVLFLLKDFRLRKQVLLKIIRAVLIFILIIFLLNVGYKKIKKTTKLNLYILIDNSYSMKFNNRLEKVKQFLQRYYKELSNKYNLKLYSFNTDLYEVRNLSDLSLSKNGTDINSIIDKFLYPLKEPFIIFLFTDGINNTNELPSIKNNLGFLVPITFQEDNFKDVSLAEVRYSKIGFKNLEHELNLEIFSFGYSNETTNVKAVDYETKEVVASSILTLKEGKNNLALKFIPQRIGKYKLMLELQKLPNEITYENNQTLIDIEIRKDKIRTLYICGQPSHEYYHLRNLLKNDPSIDLVSFVILRNPESVAIVPDEDSALIPFPVYDIFVKELFNYDLVIFENFSYLKFNIPIQYLENLRRFVLNGGGFIMIGGPNSFFLGGYKNTPIEDILPVILSEDEEWIYTEYKPEIVNFKNSLINILDDEKKNMFIWRNIPFLGNYQEINNVKEGTIVLLKYGDIPIMCYNYKGKGRVFVSLTNTTWRWSFGNLVSENDYRQLYTKFWRNIIYFVSGAEEIKNLYIVCSDRYQVSDQVNLTIISNLKEISMPSLYITHPNKNKEFLPIKKISASRYSASFIPNVEGKYIISASVKKGQSLFKDEKEIYVGNLASKEISVLKVDINYLKSLNEFYGSNLSFIENIDLNKIIDEAHNKVNEQYTEVVNVYRSPILGIVFIILFLLEIFIARFK